MALELDIRFTLHFVPMRRTSRKDCCFQGAKPSKSVNIAIMVVFLVDGFEDSVLEKLASNLFKISVMVIVFWNLKICAPISTGKARLPFFERPFVGISNILRDLKATPYDVGNLILSRGGVPMEWIISFFTTCSFFILRYSLLILSNDD
mmetsp:Transcript_659/g.1224  ORF Transcript_659/g.1224 Transcript_659/m.1224 type:complete len:149 (+) Transcript_659:167-613(+)